MFHMSIVMGRSSNVMKIHQNPIKNPIKILPPSVFFSSRNLTLSRPENKWMAGSKQMNFAKLPIFAWVNSCFY